jgi:hypothetical protein
MFLLLFIGISTDGFCIKNYTTIIKTRNGIDIDRVASESGEGGWGDLHMMEHPPWVFLYALAFVFFSLRADFAAWSKTSLTPFCVLALHSK